jgi:hypothetical protein
LPATRITNRSFGPSLKINSTGTRASENGGERMLLRCLGGAPQQTEVTRIDWNDPLHQAAVPRQALEDSGERPVAVI